MRHRTALLLAVLVAALAAAPAAAQDTVVLDFETGPTPGTPITDEYRASSFVFWQASDYNPRRRAVPGGTAADVGAEHCRAEGGSASACELPIGGTRGRLTRSADAIALRAGLFSALEQPTRVRLQGLNAAGDVVVTSPLTTITTAFTTQLSVTRPQGDLLGFRLLVEPDGGGVGAPVGFDDLTLTYPAGSLPDLALDAPGETQRLLQQRTLDVPVGITRVNGSTGPADLQVSGLPTGVTAELLPDPLPGTEERATVRLTAAPDAPRTPGGIPAEVTVTADPQGNASVGSEPRRTTFRLAVESPYDLTLRGQPVVGLPVCGTVDVPLGFGRNSGFGGDVHLEAEGVPPGVRASFTPAQDLVVAGGHYPGLALRLSADRGFNQAQVTVRASSPGAPTRRVTVTLRLTPGTVTLKAPQSAALTAPQRLREGTTVVLDTDSLCPDSVVYVGNPAGVADVTVAPDGRTLSFRTPRLATSGPITIASSIAPPFSTGPVSVATFRSRSGLPFDNFAFTGLSFEEMVDTFGADDLFLRVNPCWPWGECSIPTPVPSPTAVAAWLIIDDQMQGTGGHCFGIARAVMGWSANRATLARWTPGDAYDIPGRSAALDAFLDGQHATQASAEFIRAYFRRDKSVAAQLGIIRDQLRSGNLPLVSVRSGDSGHAMVAYDLVDRADGGVDVLLYDNNLPFRAQELTDGNDHRVREADRSVLHVAPDRRSWDVVMASGNRWSGGGSTLFATPRNAIPDDPSLPGLTTLAEGLAYLVFGSADGAVRSEGTPEGADLLPPLDASATPGASGVIGGAGALRHVVRGVAAGSYRQAVVGDGSLSSVEATTAPGVRDAVSRAPGGDGVVFAALGRSATRPVALQVATADAGVHRRVTLRTRTAGGGEDALRVDDAGRATFRHDGPATSVRLELQALQRNGGASAFVSGPIAVGRGARVTVRPSSWRTLGSVRVTVRSRTGAVRARVLRNRAAAPATLAVGRPSVRGGRARVSVTFGRLPRHRGAGVVLRVVRAGRTVARRSFPLARVVAGRRTLTWTLPAAARRRGGRLVADATLVVGGERTGTVRRSRSAQLR